LPDDVRDIDEHASRNRKSAVVKLMHTLTKSTDPEWFHKFKDALKKSGNFKTIHFTLYIVCLFSVCFVKFFL